MGVSMASGNTLGTDITNSEMADRTIKAEKLNLVEAAPSPDDNDGVDTFWLFDGWLDDKFTARTATHLRTDTYPAITTGTGSQTIYLDGTGLRSWYPCVEWTKIGTPTITGNTITMGNAEGIHCPSTGLGIGTWEITYSYQADPSSGAGSIKLNIVYHDATHLVALYSDPQNTTISLYYNNGAGVTNIIADTGVTQTDTDIHTIKATRGSSNDWELFRDGVSLGTGTQAYQPTNKIIRLENQQAENLSLYQIKVF